MSLRRPMGLFSASSSWASSWATLLGHLAGLSMQATLLGVPQGLPLWLAELDLAGYPTGLSVWEARLSA